MNFKIENSSLAQKTLSDEVNYVLEEFGLKSANDFILKVEGVIEILQRDPYIFQKYKSDTFKVVIVKQVTMYYTIELKTVSILLFWNTNRNPIDLSKML